MTINNIYCIIIKKKGFKIKSIEKILEIDGYIDINKAKINNELKETIIKNVNLNYNNFKKAFINKKDLNKIYVWDMIIITDNKKIIYDRIFNEEEIPF